jgi:hypothetical protein
VRRPEDIPRIHRRSSSRTRIIIIAVVLIVVILLTSLRSLATFYTDLLWFDSVYLGSVWHRLFDVKLGLFAVFAAIFFVLLWVNLAVVDRLAPRELALGPEDELVRRYQQAVAPRAFLVRTILAVIVALMAAAGAIGQWQNWLMFRDGVSFGVTDSQFHKDISFYVFRLPFLQFLVSWFFIALVVVSLFTLAAHYLNGGIRPQSSPRVAPQVKAHLSVLLALVAIVKSGGYILQRYSLAYAGHGYVQGPGYADVHSRLPAITLLAWISVAAALILLYNIRRRGWALPVLAVGLWALVAVVIGAIYPALLQALKVNPAQNTLELPYISRNIAATRSALNLTSINQQPFAANNNLSATDVAANASTLDAVRLWDPAVSGLNNTYVKLQAIRTYYTFTTLAIDRYMVNGVETPTVVGVRQLNQTALPSAGWVNTHLQYTHGFGMVVSPANQVTSAGYPNFAVQNVPPSSNSGLSAITQPDVYFGVDDPGYVVADTKQPEIDYQITSGSNAGTNVETHYSGSGGVQLTSFIKRASFALRFGDLNLLISSDITSKSRVMFVRDIQTEVEKAAPFLSYDADPYPVLVNGQIDWVQDAYTTTDNYPYAENINTTSLPSGSGLNQNANYVRNSVKVVINAYTGKMTFYTMDNDPIIRTWEKAFPGLFTPSSKMPAALRAHLRYPEDLFTVQAAAYGRYHITNPQAFYSAANAWVVSPDPGSGSPTGPLATTETVNAEGQVTSVQPARMAPMYEELQLPGQSDPSFVLLDAFVPYSQGTQIQNLAGFLIAGSDPDDYGQLNAYETPPGGSVVGPAMIDSNIAENTSVSQEITLLNQNGSNVLLGNVVMVPVDQSVVYIRPLYVESSTNPFPQLKEIIADYGTQVSMATTLPAALSQVFQTPVSTTPTPSTPSTSSTSSTLTPAEQNLLNEANQAYTQSQTDLKAGNLGSYQNDVNSMGDDLQQLQQLQSGSSSSNSTSSTTTTTSPNSA